MIEKSAQGRRPYAAIMLFAAAYVAVLGILVAPQGTFTDKPTQNAAALGQ